MRLILVVIVLALTGSFIALGCWYNAFTSVTLQWSSHKQSVVMACGCAVFCAVVVVLCAARLEQEQSRENLKVLMLSYVCWSTFFLSRAFEEARVDWCIAPAVYFLLSAFSAIGQTYLCLCWARLTGMFVLKLAAAAWALGACYVVYRLCLGAQTTL